MAIKKNFLATLFNKNSYYFLNLVSLHLLIQIFQIRKEQAESTCLISRKFKGTLKLNI